MSDFNRIPEHPAEAPDSTNFTPNSQDHDAGHSQSSIESLGGTRDNGPFRQPESQESPAVRTEVSSTMHRELEQREGTIDTRVAQLAAEIRALGAEAQQIRKADAAPLSPLDGLSRYCQGVVNAIGGFFAAVFGQSEPHLDEKDGRLEEITHKIGLDIGEVKSLQETRATYAELDHRIQALDSRATPEQQNTIFNAAEELQIHRFTQDLLDSLLKPRVSPGETGSLPSAQELPKPADTVPPQVPWDRHADTQPGSSPSLVPGQETPASNTPWREPLVPEHPISPSVLPDNQTTPPWRQPLIPDQADAPWRHPQPAQPEAPSEHLPEGTIVIGDQDNEKDNELVHPQGQNEYHAIGTCGVVTQEMILNRISGTHNFTESSLTNEAAASGWFDPNSGTPLAQVGNLCEKHGLHVEHKPSSLQEMAEHLAKGDQVIVGVNAGKLGDAWANDPTALGDGSVNHVVWVSGLRVETQNGESRVVGVLIHDSGVGKSYELTPEQFQQAWAPSNCHAVYVSPGIVQRGAELQ